ncbi:hypothetical protein K525DRAFT_191801 [Schizophyllum commune Loenen D]|nr:hypothetical protein K525DRAFT_191801 [Schizophyllum commune Loenen D]
MPSAASIPSYNAPVYRLPPELLSHVFLQSLPEQLFEARLNRRSRPLVISHVCGYWRDVSLNMPELWRCISLTSCASRYEHHSRKLARLYVRRTKGLDLSIHYSDAEAAITITNPLETTFLQRGVRMLPEEDRCYCALDLVIKHVARLRLFEAVVGNSSAARLSSISPLSASALQRLQVEFLQEGDHTRYLSTLVMTSPRLRWLHWTSHMGVCTISPPAEAAWSQFVEAFLGKCTITHDALLNILAVGQCLKEVTVSISRGTHASEPPRERFRQAVLEQLYIHGSEPLDKVLSALQLPALRSFSLRSKSHDLQHWPCRDTRVLRDFIASVQALDVLELTPSGSLHEGPLIDILSLPSSSSLTELYVELPMITDDLINRLRPSAKSGIPLLPHLRKLSLGECITTDGVVARMLRARCKYCYPLWNAQISFRRCDNDKHPVDDVELRRLDQFGMFARGFY